MILNVPRRENSNRLTDEGGYALMQSRLNKAYALAHPRRARMSGWAPRAHGSGCGASRRAGVCPIVPPEAVEGVAFCVLLLVGGSCGGRWSVLVSGVVGGVAVVAACVAVCGSSEQEKYKYTTKKLYKNLVI